jgi:hypothetical protein
MSRWFRLYDELLDDPKVQRLPAEDFRGWVNLLCLASRNDGKLPAVSDIGFALRTLVERLHNGGLIERRNGGANGSFYAPNKWAERQYKSDTSTQRVKRFRERSKTVAETPPDTETETETEGVSNDTPPAKISRASFPMPEGVNPEAWKDFLTNRKRKKMPNTATAHKKLMDDLNRLADAEWPIPRLLEHAAAKGWGGIYDPRNQRELGNAQTTGIGRTERAALNVLRSGALG